MLDTGIIPYLLKKLPVAGPIIIAAGLSAFLAWRARAMFEGGQDIKAEVVHLDSITVKRDEFGTALDNLRQSIDLQAKRQDSTNALLRRVICQKQTIVLCQGNQ